MPDLNIPAMQWALRVLGFALGVFVGWRWREAKEPRMYGRGYADGIMDARELYTGRARTEGDE